MKRILMVLALSLYTAGALAEEPRPIKKAGEGIEKGEAAAGAASKKVSAAVLKKRPNILPMASRKPGTGLVKRWAKKVAKENMRRRVNDA